MITQKKRQCKYKFYFIARNSNKKFGEPCFLCVLRISYAELLMQNLPRSVFLVLGIVRGRRDTIFIKGILLAFDLYCL